jgi:hypothetical protein
MSVSHFDVNSMTGRPKFIVRHSIWTDVLECKEVFLVILTFLAVFGYKITSPNLTFYSLHVKRRMYLYNVADCMLQVNCGVGGFIILAKITPVSI